MNTNLNFLLEQFGISVNNDCVVRTSFFKYFNPKEAYVSNGILNQEVVRVANNLPKEERRNKPNNAFLSNLINVRDEEASKEEDNGGLSFVYPFGATLNIQQPAFALLGSGPLSYPSNRPVCAAYVHPESQGKLVVLGSAEIFCDDYFDKEENKKILVIPIPLFQKSYFKRISCSSFSSLMNPKLNKPKKSPNSLNINMSLMLLKWLKN